MKTTASDREIARRELLTALELLGDQPAPKDGKGRTAALIHSEGLALALVEYFQAERRTHMGDARIRWRYLRQLAELLAYKSVAITPAECEERDRARLTSFRLLLGSASMHLTTQRQREEIREEVALAAR